MNFYAESVVLLWTTAMRFGQSGGRSQQALPTNDSVLESRDDVASRERIHARDGTSFTNCSAKGPQQKPGQH
jgi:hypothetical protein